MTSLWSRFESFRWTLALLLSTYVPSLLVMPVVGMAIARHLSFRDSLFALAVVTVLSYGVPVACAGTWLARSVFSDRVSSRVRRAVTLAALLTWLPHYFAVACWCLAWGIHRDGLVP